MKIAINAVQIIIVFATVAITGDAGFFISATPIETSPIFIFVDYGQLITVLTTSLPAVSAAFLNLKFHVSFAIGVTTLKLFTPLSR